MIALHDLGQPQKAISELEKLNRSVRDNPEVLLALANYHAELNQREQARAYAGQLLEMAPGNSNYQQLYRQLGGR